MTDAADRSLPSLVEEQVRKDGANDVLDQALRWSPDRWRVALPSQHSSIDRIAGLCGDTAKGWMSIRRRDAAMFADPDGNPVDLFIAVMAWGHGSNGYGPSRVARIVEGAGPSLPDKIAALAAAGRSGPVAGWDAITRDAKLAHLGPSFGTKVTYFASLALDDLNPRPLIADLNTSWAMFDLSGLRRSFEGRANYLIYVELAHEWADQLGCRPDDIERALFEIGKSRTKHLSE